MSSVFCDDFFFCLEEEEDFFFFCLDDEELFFFDDGVEEEELLCFVDDLGVCILGRDSELNMAVSSSLSSTFSNRTESCDRIDLGVGKRDFIERAFLRGESNPRRCGEVDTGVVDDSCMSRD